MNADKFNASVYSDSRVELIEIEQLIDLDFCSQLIEIAKHELHPSTTTTEEQGFRTSFTNYLDAGVHTEVKLLDELLSRFIGLELDWGEPLQCQVYRPGCLFKPHTDYFDLLSAYEQYAHWQRTWTFMVVLQAAELGGATHFPDLGVSFKPKAGGAILWNNLYHDGTPNPWTLHEGTKVLSGEKIIITKWFKDR